MYPAVSRYFGTVSFTENPASIDQLQCAALWTFRSYVPWGIFGGIVYDEAVAPQELRSRHDLLKQGGRSHETKQELSDGDGDRLALFFAKFGGTREAHRHS